jgi:hypothetical protein
MKVQCWLEQVETSQQTVAWIDTAAANTDFQVELLAPGNKSLGLFKVKAVYSPELTDEALTVKQSFDKRGFPSTKG